MKTTIAINIKPSSIWSPEGKTRIQIEEKIQEFKKEAETASNLECVAIAIQIQCLENLIQIRQERIKAEVETMAEKTGEGIITLIGGIIAALVIIAIAFKAPH